MRIAITFNNQPPPRAGEIGKVRPDWVLTPKLEAAQVAMAQVAITQQNLKCTFRYRCFAPKPLRELSLFDSALHF